MHALLLLRDVRAGCSIAPPKCFVDGVHFDQHKSWDRALKRAGIAGGSVCREGNRKHVDFINVELRVRLGMKVRWCRVISDFEESVRQSSARLPKLAGVVSHRHRGKIASSEALRLFFDAERTSKDQQSPLRPFDMSNQYDILRGSNGVM